MLNCVVTKYGSVLADERRTELTVSAKTDCALHVSFHRDINAVSWHPTFLEFANGKPHHHLRTTHHRQRIAGIKLCSCDQGCHYPNVACPILARSVHGQKGLKLYILPQIRQLLSIKNVVWSTCTVDKTHSAEYPAFGKHFIDHRPQRRQPDSAGNNQYVLPGCLLHRPTGSARSVWHQLRPT